MKPTRETYGGLQRAYDFYNERLFEDKLPGALITLQRRSKSCGYYIRDKFGSKGSGFACEIALNPEYFGQRSIRQTLSTLVHESIHQQQALFYKPGRTAYHNAEFSELMLKAGLQTSSTGLPGGKTVGEKMSHYILIDGAFDTATDELLGEDGFELAWFDRFPSETGCVYEARFKEGTTPEQAYASLGLVPPKQKTKRPPEAFNGDESDAQEVTGREPSDVDSGEFPAKDAQPKDQGRPQEGEDYFAKKKKAAKSKTKYTCGGCKANIWGKEGLNVKCGDCEDLFIPQAA